MKNITLILAFVFWTGSCLAQETKKTTTETENPFSKEVYSVLKTDKKIRHGNYAKYDWKNRMLEKGQYEFGKKIGIWEFYNWNGELDQKYNFTDNKIDWNSPTDSKLVIQTEMDGQFVDVKPDQFPTFIGGQYRFQRFTFTVKYPVEARRNGTQGTVLLSFIITSDGKMIDEKIEHGIGSGCDEAALIAFESIPDEWIPAQHKGESKNVKIFYPFKFKLE